MTSPSPLADPDLAAAVGGDASAFQRLVARHRRELLAHGYRMLGSVHDAEDALQEALLAAWQGLRGFAGHGSLRGWLYKITTNVCLRAIGSRPRRMLSPEHGPARRPHDDLGDVVGEPIWLEPWADDDADDTPAFDPSSRYLRRESVELAFIAALQHLPGTQRAALLLCEVLDFSAQETADIVGASVAAVNSALQRARKTIESQLPARTQQDELATLGDPGQRHLVQNFIAAWESRDVPRLVGLLTEDVRFAMPPLPAWFEGRDDVAGFFAARVFAQPWRVVPRRINGQLGFACYMRDPASERFRLSAVNVVSLRGGKIHALTGFLDPTTHRAFGLPEEI